MSLYSQFKTDAALEKDGVILQYGNNSDGKPIQITIARAGGSNVRFMKSMDHHRKPYRRQIQNDTLDPETATVLLAKVYAESVILGWSGVEDENGNLMDYNVKNCEKLLIDLPDLFIDIQEQANKVALFREELLEAEAKN